MINWPPVAREDLLAGDAHGFSAALPELVRRLILETCGAVTSIDMPSGGGTAIGGFDGVVTAAVESLFVPSGTSVWEFSVEDRPAKADEDYVKRLTAPLGLQTEQVTYVQILLAKWRDARAWATARNAEGRWAEVRAYRADTVMTWIEAAPGTAAWLGHRLGKAVHGVTPISTWWADGWLPSTSPELNKKFVLAGRKEQSERLVRALDSGQQVVRIAGDLRPDDLRAFIAAALSGRDGLELTRLGVRTLLVDDVDALRTLAGQPRPLILVLTDATLTRETSIAEHQVVLPAGPGGVGDISLPPLESRAVADLFVAGGMSHEEASRLGGLSRRSLGSLRRRLALRPESLVPEWARDPDAIQRRLLLVGGWTDGWAPDEELVAELVGATFFEVSERAIKLSRGHDSPFWGRTGELSYLLAPADAWQLLGSALVSGDLRGFSESCNKVYGPTISVRSDLDQASTSEGARKAGLSRQLRRSMARSLALLGSGVLGERLLDGLDGEGWATTIVRGILRSGKSERFVDVLVSLCDVLSLLAEAAPGVFIDTMRKELRDAPESMTSLFRDGEQDAGRPLATRSPHTDVLWALERLAWSEDHVDDVVEVLADLAELDPGGQLSNRPRSSLIGILSAWSPQTNASAGVRSSILRRLGRVHPSIAARVALRLIPNGHSTQVAHPSPEFRNWKQADGLTIEEVRFGVDAAVDVLLDCLPHVPEFYPDVLGRIGDLSSDHREGLAQRLNQLASSDEATRQPVYVALRGALAHHREYADADWALPEADLAPLQISCDLLTPAGPTLRHAYLFDDRVLLGDVRKRDDYPAYDAELLRRRADAVGEVMAQGGLPATIAFAESTKKPGLIGLALARHTQALDGEMLAALGQDITLDGDVALSYLHERVRQDGDNLGDSLLKATNDHMNQARILRLLQDPKNAWRLFKQFDPEVENAYWSGFMYYGLGHGFPEVLRVSRGMLEAGRAAAAVAVLVLYDADGLPAARLAADALDQLLANGAADPELRELTEWTMEKVFSLLAGHRSDLGASRLIMLEWNLYPLLGFEPDAPNLQAAVVENANVFCELVELAFRAGDGDEAEIAPGAVSSQEFPTEEQRIALATRAYEVLHDLKHVPGQSADGRIDRAVLRAWVDTARQRFKQSNRVQIGDQQLGALLAHSLPAITSTIPREVSEILEDLRSDDLEVGLHIGIRNRRDVTIRGLHDGGTQEGELADTYKQLADVSRELPRSAKIMRSLADAYRLDALREDAEAEIRRRDLSR